jgi:hypothetical protein
MPDAPLPTSPPEQVVRFRMQTLLAVTAVVAVLAAIAGPFYRRQTPEAQYVLLIYWACAAIGASLGMFITWRSSWKLPERAGTLTCVLWIHGRGFGVRSRLVTAAFFLFFWLGFLAFQSYAVAIDHASMMRSWFLVIKGLAHGMMMSGFLMIFVPRPFYLCENGVAMGPVVIPWNYIRSAQWVATNRSVLRLHRLDGDLFVRVPDQLRDGVTKLVAERTRFEGETAHLAPGQ